METKNIVDVENFVIECNDFLTGKFFDLNRRLQKFLSVMTQSEDVLDALADALVDFDEDSEFDKAFVLDRKTGAAKINLPTEEKKRLALSVTIFDDIANGKLNSNQFLETFFQNSKIAPTQYFLEKIVLPFRDIICKTFEIPADISILDIKKQEQEMRLAEQKEAEEIEKEQKRQEDLKKAEQFPHLDELFEEISKNCQNILSLISFEKKRGDFLDDIEFMTNATLEACREENLMIVNALVIGLSAVAKKFKNARHIIDDMKNLILDYYDFLAGGTMEDSAPQTDEETGDEGDEDE